MIKISLALGGLLGLAIAIGLVAFYGFVEIAETIAGVGWGVLAVIAFHLLQMGFSARAWQILLPRPVALGLPAVSAVRWVREAVNNLLPVAQIGGEFVGARLLRMGGISLGAAGASATVDLTMEMMSQIVFTLLGLALLIPSLQDASVAQWMMAGLGLATIVLVLFISAQRFGFFRLIERGLVSFARRAGWSSLGDVAGLDEAIQVLYKSPARLSLAGAHHLISWLLGGFEVMLILYLVGVSVDLREGLIIESLGQALRAVGFAVPGGLGIQEGGYVLICGLLGISPQAAIELSLLKRIREVALGVPALILWQVVESRRLAARAGAGAIFPAGADGD